MHLPLGGLRRSHLKVLRQHITAALRVPQIRLSLALDALGALHGPGPSLEFPSHLLRALSTYRTGDGAIQRRGRRRRGRDAGGALALVRSCQRLQIQRIEGRGDGR